MKVYSKIVIDIDTMETVEEVVSDPDYRGPVALCDGGGDSGGDGGDDFGAEDQYAGGYAAGEVDPTAFDDNGDGGEDNVVRMFGVPLYTRKPNAPAKEKIGALARGAAAGMATGGIPGAIIGAFTGALPYAIDRDPGSDADFSFPEETGPGDVSAPASFAEPRSKKTKPKPEPKPEPPPPPPAPKPKPPARKKEIPPSAPLIPPSVTDEAPVVKEIYDEAAKRYNLYDTGDEVADEAIKRRLLLSEAATRDPIDLYNRTLLTTGRGLLSKPRLRKRMLLGA